MRTWSLAAVIGAATDVASQLLSCGRWTPGHDYDRPLDGAEELAEREAEEECLEPADDAPLSSCVECLKPVWWDAEWEKWYHSDDNSAACAYADEDSRRIAFTPGIHTESDCLCVYNTDGGWPDKVCGVCRPVRDIVEQMLEERFPPRQSELADRLARINAAHDVPVPPAGASGEGGEPPSSSSPRPAWTDLADAMVHHKGDGLLAAVRGVLSEHYEEHPTRRCRCGRDSWREHTAQLIADVVAAQQK